MRKIAHCFIMSLLFLGCARPQRNLSAHEDFPTLPPSWYMTRENLDDFSTPDFVEPSEEMDSSVEASFQTQTSVLTDLESSAHFEFLNAKQDVDGRPADWTPWHLDGMIASFAVDATGVFGLLTVDGTASIKGTWQMQQAKTSPRFAKANKKSSLSLTSATNEQDLDQILEPTVRAVLSTHSVKNEKAFRATLKKQAAEFLSICRSLDAIGTLPGWYVSGYELQLTFNADGVVAPLVSAGGGINIYFDWQRTNVTQPTTSHSELGKSKLHRNMKEFTQAIASMVHQAKQDSPEIRRSGFDLNQFQVGIAVTVGGNVGIAQMQSGVCGKIIFKAIENKTPYTTLASLLEYEDDTFINLVAPRPSAEQLAYLQTAAIKTIEDSQNNEIVYRIPTKKFRVGARRAIKMGNYFTHKAKETDTSKWKVIQIEAEFDLAITGYIGMATLTGQGQFVLDFNRVGANTNL